MLSFVGNMKKFHQKYSKSYPLESACACDSSTRYTKVRFLLANSISSYLGAFKSLKLCRDFDGVELCYRGFYYVTILSQISPAIS